MEAFDALLIGEALIDRLPEGEVVGGAPLNVARHLQGLGCSALLVSRVGTDAEAEPVRRALRVAGLSEQGLQTDAHRPTGTVDVAMQADGHRFHIAADVAWDALDADAALGALRAAAPRLLVFGSLAQRGALSRAAVRAVLAGSDALRFLDLNLREGVSPPLALESMQLAHWAKLNDEELAQLLTWTGQPDAAALCARLGLRRLLVTRGAAGYASWGEVVCEGEGVAADPFVDTVGAGDAFSACLLAAHLQRKAWAPALQLANRFAAALCGQRGAAPADPSTFYLPWQAALRELPDALP
jgi:fructokinase